MSKCKKVKYNFCGNINQANPSSPLSMTYFQYTPYDVSTIYRSSWVCHFSDGPIQTDDIGSIFFRYLGKTKFTTYTPNWQVGMNYVMIRPYYILDDFSASLTWTQYTALSSQIISILGTRNKYSLGNVYRTSFAETNIFGEDGEYGSYFLPFTPISVTAYGISFEILDGLLTGFSGLAEYFHPEVLGGNVNHIKDNYLLLRAIT